MSEFSVSYTKRVQCEAMVDVDDSLIEERFSQELNADDAEANGTTLRLTVEIDVEDIIREQVEAGRIRDEESIDEEYEDIELTGN